MNIPIPSFIHLEKKLASELLYGNDGALASFGKDIRSDGEQKAVEKLLQRYSQKAVNLKDQNILEIFENSMKTMISIHAHLMFEAKQRERRPTPVVAADQARSSKSYLQTVMEQVGWLKPQQIPKMALPPQEEEEWIVLDTSQSQYNETCMILENWKKKPELLLNGEQAKEPFDRIRQFLRDCQTTT